MRQTDHSRQRASSVVAIVGYLTSRQVPQRKAVDPELKINWNAWKETWHIVQFAREERSVFLSILGISWFWFFGSAMTIQIPAYTLDVLNGNETITTPAARCVCRWRRHRLAVLRTHVGTSH